MYCLDTKHENYRRLKQLQSRYNEIRITHILEHYVRVNVEKFTSQNLITEAKTALFQQSVYIFSHYRRQKSAYFRHLYKHCPVTLPLRAELRAVSEGSRLHRNCCPCGTAVFVTDRYVGHPPWQLYFLPVKQRSANAVEEILDVPAKESNEGPTLWMHVTAGPEPAGSSNFIYSRMLHAPTRMV